MEFSEYNTNEVLDPVDVEFYDSKPRTSSPSPVLTTNVSCDLEDILSDVSIPTSILFFIKLYVKYRGYILKRC